MKELADLTPVQLRQGTLSTHSYPVQQVQDSNLAVEGVKYDSGKTRYDLIPAYPLEQLAAVYTMGAKKYADENWRKGISWKRIFSSLNRHLWAFWRGEELDPESGLSHLAHVAWNAFTLLEYTRSRKEFDDRHKATE
jgi:hypothetical protein